MSLDHLNGTVFYEKSGIKPWLTAELRPLGVQVVIERSDDSKIVFKCKSPQLQHMKGAPMAKRSKTHSCPFRIRANYSIRAKRWTLVVVNANHNHNHHGGIHVTLQQQLEGDEKPQRIEYPITPESPKNESTLPPLIPHYTEIIYQSAQQQQQQQQQQQLPSSSNNTQLPALPPALPIPSVKSLHGDVINLLTTMNTTLSINDQIKERVYEQMILTMKTVVPHHKLNKYYL